MLPLEGILLKELRNIEAPHAGTKVDGEREAARRSREDPRLAEIRNRKIREAIKDEVSEATEAV